MHQPAYYLYTVVYRYIFKRVSVAGVHRSIGHLLNAEQHFEYRHYESEREQRKKRRQYVEYYIKRQILLVGRHKAFDDLEKVVHDAKLMKIR